MEPIDPEERLSRFIDQHRQYSVENRRVKPGAFNPDKGLETSVFRTEGRSEDEIWRIGVDYVEPEKKRRILARGDLKAREPVRIGLTVEPEEPPPGHANIKGWPEKGGESAKALEKHLAHALAQEAILVVRPSPLG